MVADTSTHDDRAEVLDAVDLYWRYRRRTARTLVTIAVAIVLFVVFEPGRWFQQEAGTAVHYAAWSFVGLLVVLAFRWNGEMAEQHGFCLGKCGHTPSELQSKEAPAE